MHTMKILEKSEFIDLIYYERARSERTNSPFSLIQVDLSRINGGMNGQSLEKIIKTIELSVRTIDRIGWIENNILGVFLPETKLTGAKAVAVKFKNILTKSLGEDFPLFSFVVTTYPELPDSREHKLHKKIQQALSALN